MSVQSDLLSLFAPGTTIIDGELVIGGVPATQLAAEFGTPAYVIDEGYLRDRVRAYRDGLASRWPNSRVYFASKSFPSTPVYRVMAEEGIGVDVAGGGEIVMALAGGVPGADLLLHGNAKTDAELRMALEAGVGLIVIDNFRDIERIEALANSPVEVLVRVRPNVGAATHAAMATATDASKFGLRLDDAREAIRRIEASTNLVMKGLHVHVGSQILEAAPFAEAIAALGTLGEFEIYDLGGGLGERYTYADAELTLDDYLDAVVEAARAALPPTARILLEPGRSLVARAGCTLYEIVNVKSSDSAVAPTFVAVNGGMADNLEVSLYGQRFEATIVDAVGGGEPVTVVGRHCESGDMLSEGVPLRDPEPGDIVAVPVTGAYCFTMSNNYNGALRPPVVFVRDGLARAVVRRETYADLIVRDVTF
ncbi:MAG: diaminopimelate decarboxylase [Actinomycetes bacterium]